MARARRIDVVGGIHHVMNRGVNRGLIFFGDEDRIEFGARLAELHRRFGIETLAYCLMGNHYHLLLRAVHGGLSAGMHHLGTTYTRRINDRLDRDGPLFRGRYHSIHVTSDAYLLWVTRYIHRNPLDIAEVATPEAYRWSSYRTFLGLRARPDFLNPGPVLSHFAGATDLREFTSDDSPRSARWRPESIVDLVQMIDFEIACDDLHHVDDDGSTPPWRSRTILVLLTDNENCHLAHDIERHLAFPSGNARRMALSRARTRWEDDEAIRRILVRVTANCTEGA